MNLYKFQCASEYTQNIPTFQKLSRKKNNEWNDTEAKRHSYSKKDYRAQRGVKRAWEEM